MVNNTFRKFSGQSAIVSLNGSQIMCVYDYNKIGMPAIYLVRDCLVYAYKTAFVNSGLFYAVYDITDLSFTKLVSFVEKTTSPTVIEFVYD